MAISSALDFKRAAVISLLLVLLIIFFPPMTLFLIPIAVAPISYVLVNYGFKRGLMLVGMADVLVFAALLLNLSSVNEAFRLVIPLLALPTLAITFYYSYTKEIPSFQNLLTGSAAFIGTGLLSAVLIFELMHVNIFRQIASEIYFNFAQIMNTSGNDILAVSVREITDLLPGTLVVLSIMLSAIHLFFYYWKFEPKLDEEKIIRPLGEWYIPWQLSYGFLAGLASKFYRSDWAFSRQVEIIGNNLLFIFSVIFFIQGLAVISHVLGKSNIKKPLKWLAFTFMIFLQYTIQLLTWLGLLDVWFDYRRKMNKKPEEVES